jgi:mannose-6-phosphate isomerase-like protein (cupin superfamily)
MSHAAHDGGPAAHDGGDAAHDSGDAAHDGGHVARHAGAGAARAASFPGGVGLSHLRVYDWPTPDGAGAAGGGSPHLHTVSGEAYVVLGGSGGVQTLGSAGYAEHDLATGTVLWFTPGTVHRLVNDGDLEILVVMQTSGLPEAGDAVLTFPPEVLDDPARYAEAARLPTGDALEVAGAARRRRDLALTGYADLVDAVQRRGPAALTGLYEAAARLVAHEVPAWRQTWEAGVQAQTRATDEALTALAAAAGQGTAHLADATTRSVVADPGPRRAGMCGWLRTYPLPPRG